MAQFDAIVIGAGHNGLASAVMLQKAGLRTLCLESKLYSGGMASTVELFDGFKFEIAGSEQFPTSLKVSQELGLDQVPSVEQEVMSVNMRGIGDEPFLFYSDPMKLLTHMNEVHGAEAVNGIIERHCVSDADEEWDLDGLVTDMSSYYPSTITADQYAKCRSTDQIYDLVMQEATGYYTRREEELSPEVMREVERQVMLRIIDQRWREHLFEMDYLQEGINLRAMGQKDPLVEWQREGFEMFGELMKGIADDFVRYVMHVQVVRNEPEPPPVRNLLTLSSETENVSGFSSAAQAGPVEGEDDAGPAAAPASAPAATTTRVEQVVNDEWAKTGRNDPCPCGSGKKYKNCHANAR